jgi:pSer/pThr/pTyr-binding forkhead associated (FHA) protein
VDPTGKWLIKDTKSSSGTFLNHVRLSTAGQESKPHQLKDGDILQLGVDYQGGAEDMYKSVKIRVELGREWQAVPNVFKYDELALISPPEANCLANITVQMLSRTSKVLQ